MTKESSNWSDILYLKDVTIYLSFISIINLSICSKKLRDRLYYNKFKPFNLREYLNKGGYKLFEHEEEGKKDLHNNPYHKSSEVILENINKFENELQKIDLSVKTLVIYDIYDYLYGYKIVERFDKISTLDLNLCVITRELLQYMFNKLPLSELSIKSTTILTEECTADIIMPQSLSKLMFTDIKYIHIKDNNEPFPFMNKHTIHHLQDYNLTPQHIPSLKTLHYSSNSPLELTNFIDLNPQLKSIRVHQGQISDNTYTKLSSHNQIKQLFIESFEFTRNYIFKLPVIFSLKSLCIRLDDDFDYSMELINAFPNITRFSVKYNYVVDNLNILWFSSKFQKLKYLRLEFVEGLEADDKFDFPKFCELEVLEFICADEGVFNCEELGEGNKLKLIKFYDYPASKGIPIGYKINEVRNWKILSYNDSRVYYKH